MTDYKPPPIKPPRELDEDTAGVDVLVFVHDGATWRYAKAGA